MSQPRVDVVVDGFSHRFGGGVVYLKGLLPALAVRPEIKRVRLLVEPTAVLAGELADTPVDVVEVALCPPGSLIARVAWEAAVLRRHVSGAVVIAPAAMLPRRLRAPVVAVPHNVLPFDDRAPRSRLQRWAIGRTLGWAAGCIFVSEASRRLITSQVSPPPVSAVVHHGLAEAFLDQTASELRREGIVCVADGYPHKRLPLLVKAWRRLGPDRPALTLVGRRLTGTPEPEAGLRCVSNLSQVQVANLLRTAQVVVLPSERESFGMPAVEALACGAPLVASDIPSYRELTAGHARLISSADPGVWSAAIAETLADPPPADPGRAWARAFTWERAAEATAEVLCRVASSATDTVRASAASRAGSAA